MVGEPHVVGNGEKLGLWVPGRGFFPDSPGVPAQGPGLGWGPPVFFKRAPGEN